MPAPVDLPSTLERSDAHAQDLYSAALASAIDQYGDGARAHQTAFAALKHEYEKVGDHWERKAENGPSDDGGDATEEGVDANATKAHLQKVARRLQVSGRSTMTKDELVEAIKKANARETAKARS
jgi:cation transport regulator ChaB